MAISPGAVQRKEQGRLGIDEKPAVGQQLFYRIILMELQEGS
jgi:hypothetical protein